LIAFASFRTADAAAKPAACLDFTLTAPFTHGSTTAGAGNGCVLRGSNDGTYPVATLCSGSDTFSTCGGASRNTYLCLTAACCGGAPLLNSFQKL
jgi:hypothetical protein